jgi:SOS-response transcriptional repressor LexA
METPITPVQKLDVILYISSVSEQKNLQGFQSYLKDNASLELSTSYIQKILERLQKDGYVKLNPSSAWTITFDGEVFKDAGGYNARFLAEAAEAEQQQLEIDRLKSVDASNDQNQKMLNKLTNRLTWGTWFAFGAALALLIWTIVQHFLERNCQK